MGSRRRYGMLWVLAPLLAVAIWWASASTRPTVDVVPGSTAEKGPAGASSEPSERTGLQGQGGGMSAGPAPIPDRTGSAGFFGVVLAEDRDEPVAGARVRALRQDGGAQVESSTGSDGRFELEGSLTSDDAYRLVVTKDGFARFVDLRAQPSVHARTIRLERGGFIAGKVEGGQGASLQMLAIRRTFAKDDAVDVVLLTAGQSTPHDLRVEANAKGIGPERAFRLGPLRAGDYALVFHGPGLPGWMQLGGAREYEQKGGIAVLAGKTTDVGTLVFPSIGSIDVRVLDAATEQPVIGATIQWENDVDRHALRLPIEPSEVRADGTYVLPQVLEKGNAAVTALGIEKEGYAPGHLSFYGQANGEHFDVRLTREGALQGVLHGDDGTATVRARVFVLREVDGIACGSATTDELGRFAIDSLPAGEDLHVDVLDPTLTRVLTTVPLRLTPGEHRRLDLGTTDRTAVEGTVKVAGVAVKRALLSLDAPGGRRSQIWTAADGRFRFEHLEPGRYELYISIDEPDCQAGATLEVQSGKTTDATLDLSCEIRGVVTVEGETTPAEISLVARRVPSEGAWRAECRSEKDGTFVLRPAGPGLYRVEADDPDYATPSPVEVDLTSTPVAAGVHLRIEKEFADGLIVLEVGDAETGMPLPDADYRFKHRWTSGAGSSNQGVIRFDDASPGPYFLTVDEPLHASEELTVEITRDSKELRRSVRLKPSRAVRVTVVEEGGRAQVAGVRVGDVLLGYRGARIRTWSELRSAISGTKPEDSVALDILREGKPLTVTVPGGRMGIGGVNHWTEKE